MVIGIIILQILFCLGHIINFCLSSMFQITLSNIHCTVIDLVLINACRYMIVMVTVTLIYVLLALRLGTHLSKLAICHIHMHNYDK